MRSSTWAPPTAAEGSRTRSEQSRLEGDAALASDAAAEEKTDAAAERTDSGAAEAGGRSGGKPNRPNQGQGGSSGSTNTNTVPSGAGAPNTPITMVDAGAMSEPAPQDAGAAPQVDAAMAPVDVPTTPEPAPDAGTTTTPPPPVSLCTPGMYSGGFTGSVRARGQSVSTPFGAISGQLTLDATGQYLELRDARIYGIDRDRNALSVLLAGRINCASGVLEDGHLEDGTFFFAERRATFTFSGTAEATYTNDPPSIDGTWDGQADDATWVKGAGDWTLSLRNE